MKYQKPFSEEIETSLLCQYGCSNVARYKFRNGKLCCSVHYNSCPGKIKNFSELDHTERTAKSLKTRTDTGVTKTCQIKGGKTRVDSGHYRRLATKMQDHWAKHPWQNNIQCPILKYKTTDLVYQGSHEYEFLEMLEERSGIIWIENNVLRGPSIYYNDPSDNKRRLYISDFTIGDKLYEIKSSWTWNKHGEDKILENKNKAKLDGAVNAGYEVFLVLDGKEIKYEKFMD